MLVSVVVVTYNSAQFVLETLDSIAAQTYPELELVITDDCSKDDTVAICRDWLEQHKQRFVHTKLLTVEKNTGIAGNCNRGYAAAQGEWIKGIAGDDLLLPDCIERYVQFAATHPENIFLSYLQEFGAGSKLHKPRNAFEKASSRQQLDMFLSVGLFLCAPTFFCRKTLWKKVGGFDERYPLFEDSPFQLNVLLAKERIGLVPEVLVKYRVHSTSVSKNGGYSKDHRAWLSDVMIPFQWKYGHWLTAWHNLLTLWRNDAKRPAWINRYPVYGLWLLLDPIAFYDRFLFHFSK